MNNSDERKVRILIVDDNPQNLQVLGKFLKSSGYKVEFALNGKSALEWMETERFDLILLDIMMPGISGLSLCKMLREKKEYDAIPIIFISADNNKSTILEGFEYGAQDYITKPFDHHELLARVKTQLDLKFSREDLMLLNNNLEKTVLDRTAELKDALSELEEANRQLREIEQIKTDFLNIISHEIRTPLNGIMGPLELIRLKLDDPKILRLVELLDQSVSRLEKFSYAALIITELRTHKRPIAAVAMSLNQITDAILAQENPVVIKKGLKIRTIHTLKETTVTGDKHLITSCIQCLIDRAGRFSPESGQITVTTGSDSGRPFWEVSSEILSIPANYTQKNIRIFEADNQITDNNPGLDFALAHLVMEAHGGDLVISNLDQGGTSLRLNFPESKAEAG